MIARYRTLLSTPGFTRLLLGSIVARMPSGMFSLAILLFVRAHTNSFLAAGTAVGSFALAGALAGPALGAMVDRVGQTRVLLPAACTQAALLLALVLVTNAGAPVAALVALAALAGAAQPPLAGCIRALWAQLARDQQALETAYALDATTQEVIWTLGPLLVGSTAVLISPAAAVLLCAAITVCGTTFFAACELSRSWSAPPATHSRAGALASGGLRALLGTAVLAGVVIGAVEVGLPALAVQHGGRAAAGPLLALFSVGSMIGGLLYSAVGWRRSVGLRYVALLLAMAACVTPLLATHTLTAAYPLSVLAGLGLAPMLSCQFSLVGTLAPSGAATEAFTWHRGAVIAGSAAGSTLGGSLVESQGATAAFALGAIAVVLAGALAALWRQRIDPTPVTSGASTPLIAG